MDLIAEIRAAWPVTPYPGDHILSDCWCEECEADYRKLRGKSWKQVKLANFCGENGRIGLGPEAFAYYLPGILILSVQESDDFDPCNVIGRFVFSDHQAEGPERQQDIRQLVGSFSKRQRQVLLFYFDWLSRQGWQAPMLITAAKRAISDNLVEPYSYNELLSWCQQRERDLKNSSNSDNK